MARILVVDDEKICVMLLSQSLQEEGHEVLTASSGEQGLDVGLPFAPELIITDWKLGGTIDGIDVALALQEKNPEIRVILFSGLPAEDVRAKADGLEVFCILEKPCELEAMMESAFRALEDLSRKTGATVSPTAGSASPSK